ncbi:MAG: sensor histidine kinase [Bacteriovoracaceae bacterium]
MKLIKRMKNRQASLSGTQKNFDENAKLKSEFLVLKDKYKDMLIENAMVHNLSRSLLLQQEEYRKEISRELHDEIAQVLSGINFELAVLIEESKGSAERLQQKILETRKLVVDSVEVIHRFARELRPLILDDLGLVDALNTLTSQFTKRTSIKIGKIEMNEHIILNERKNTVLYRIAQEALTNIEKHSKGKKVSVKLSLLNNIVTLKVFDNGKIFETRKSKKNKTTGVGLIGMEERLKIVDGTFSIKSSEKAGTTIIASVKQDLGKEKLKKRIKHK